MVTNGNQMVTNGNQSQMEPMVTKVTDAILRHELRPS